MTPAAKALVGRRRAAVGELVDVATALRCPGTVREVLAWVQLRFARLRRVELQRGTVARAHAPRWCAGWPEGIGVERVAPSAVSASSGEQVAEP